MGVVGELLITFGVLVLLFAVYELKVTDYRAAGTQHRLHQQLTRTWTEPEVVPTRDKAVTTTTTTPRPPKGPLGITPPPAVQDSQGFAVMRIPRFGAGYHWVAVEGVSESDLQMGPGHYPGTALPGQIGNVVISGHRTTYGHPFWDADSLRPGDAIDLQVRDRVYRYRVTGSRSVDPSDLAVTYPVPDQPGVAPTKRLLTLTTCTPRFSAAQRLIISAELSVSDVLPAPAGAG